MTALNTDRTTPRRDGVDYVYPVAAATKIYAGSIVVLDSAGNAAPMTAATGLITCGVAQETIDNSGGSAGDLSIKVKTGVFRLENGQTITKAHIGDTLYGLDDQTVYRTATSKSPVGACVDVDSLGVWVYINPPFGPVSTGLLAANNLSDVGTVATARSSLGLDTGDSPVFAALTISGAAALGSSTSVGTRTGRQKWQTVAASTYTVTTADGDIVIQASADNDVVNLPAAAAGTKGQRITVFCDAANGGAKVSISPNAVDGIYGGVNGGSGGSLVSFSGTDNKDAILTKATQLKGDYLVLVCDGTNGWYVVGGQGVWASEA